MQHFIHFVASLVLTFYISVRSFQNFSPFYHFFLKKYSDDSIKNSRM